MPRSERCVASCKVVGVTALELVNHAEVHDAACAAARRAGVTVRLVSGTEEIRDVSDLLAEVWGTAPAASPGPRNVLAAIADTGGYVAGAWSEGSLVGASYGVTYLEGSAPCLRSQVTGVLHPRRGVGEALKRHQQQWALESGMRRITWTFDPLVRRNAHFNLDRLGARIVRFVPDFYGPLDDGVNGTEATDRCVVSWPVSGGGRSSGPVDSEELLRAGHVLLLGVDGDGGPAIVRPPDSLGGSAVLLATPSDIVGLRSTNPAAAAAWRNAARAAFSAALEAGLVSDLITTDGWYRFRSDEGAR